MRIRNLLAALAVALYALPAAATWSAATAVDTPLVDRSTVNTHTWTTVSNSGTLDVSACDEVQVAFDPSTGDTSTDATVDWRGCDTSGQNAGSCQVLTVATVAEGVYQKVSSPKQYILARAATATAGGDTASATVKCIEKVEYGEGLIDADGDLTGIADLTATGTITGETLASTGAVDEDFGLDLDQVVGTPTAAAANHVKVVNDDLVLSRQVTTTVEPIVATSGASVTNGIPRFTSTAGGTVQDSGATIVGEVLSLPAASTGNGTINMYEDTDSGGGQKIVFRGLAVGQNLSSDLTINLSRSARAVPVASGARGPVIGAVSNGGTFDTGTELCELTYNESNGLDATCLAGTCKSYDPTTAVATRIACADAVTTSTEFSCVCNVE